MESRNDCFREVAFLTRSPNRVRILHELRHDGPLEKRDLRDRFDCDRTTIQRNVDALADHGWVQQSNHIIRITTAGELVAAGLTDCFDAAETAIDLQPVLRWLPDDALDFDLALLKDAEIVVADSTDPGRAVSRHLDALQAAERFRGFIPSIGRHALETAWRRVTNGHGNFEVVIPAASVDSLDAGSKYAEMFDDLLDSDRIDVLVADNDISYYLGIIDGVVQIGIKDDTGMRRALLETEQHAVRAWAEETYQEYKHQASVLAGDSRTGPEQTA